MEKNATGQPQTSTVLLRRPGVDAHGTKWMAQAFETPGNWSVSDSGEVVGRYPRSPDPDEGSEQFAGAASQAAVLGCSKSSEPGLGVL